MTLNTLKGWFITAFLSFFILVCPVSAIAAETPNPTPNPESQIKSDSELVTGPSEPTESPTASSKESRRKRRSKKRRGLKAPLEPGVQKLAKSFSFNIDLAVGKSVSPDSLSRSREICTFNIVYTVFETSVKIDLFLKEGGLSFSSRSHPSHPDYSDFPRIARDYLIEQGEGLKGNPQCIERLFNNHHLCTKILPLSIPAMLLPIRLITYSREAIASFENELTQVLNLFDVRTTKTSYDSPEYITDISVGVFDQDTIEKRGILRINLNHILNVVFDRANTPNFNTLCGAREFLRLLRRRAIQLLELTDKREARQNAVPPFLLTC
jgi:hypothetical protein